MKKTTTVLLDKKLLDDVKIAGVHLNKSVSKIISECLTSFLAENKNIMKM